VKLNTDHREKIDDLIIAVMQNTRFHATPRPQMQTVASFMPNELNKYVLMERVKENFGNATLFSELTSSRNFLLAQGTMR
jgi:hypothetical protein